jgi:hypothetical protein
MTEGKNDNNKIEKQMTEKKHQLPTLCICHVAVWFVSQAVSLYLALVLVG